MLSLLWAADRTTTAGTPQLVVAAVVAIAAIVLLIVWLVTGMTWIALAGVVAVGALFVYQHSLVKPSDLSRMNAAFFTANGYGAWPSPFAAGLPASFPAYCKK